MWLYTKGQRSHYQANSTDTILYPQILISSLICPVLTYPLLSCPTWKTYVSDIAGHWKMFHLFLFLWWCDQSTVYRNHWILQYRNRHWAWTKKYPCMVDTSVLLLYDYTKQLLYLAPSLKYIGLFLHKQLPVQVNMEQVVFLGTSKITLSTLLKDIILSYRMKPHSKKVWG